ncbi:MAG: hypothetical protein JSU65_09480 [Candidatus Zixiibacteriota bacterium]|nr:MAG: hypothetical protein JSU65_09480 [candidate division Zixibacteria bacterium]
MKTGIMGTNPQENDKERRIKEINRTSRRVATLLCIVIAVVATFWGDSIDEWLGWSPGIDDGFLVVAIVLVVSTLMWWHKRRMHHRMDKTSKVSRDSDRRH